MLSALSESDQRKIKDVQICLEQWRRREGQEREGETEKRGISWGRWMSELKRCS